MRMKKMQRGKNATRTKCNIKKCSPKKTWKAKEIGTHENCTTQKEYKHENCAA